MSFDEFWAIYPRRIAKLSAKKAWAKALKHAQECEILAGAERYANERRDENQQFTKHPATWLNGGCWEDEPGHNGGGHEKGFAEIAEDLRRERLAGNNGAKYSSSEPDLFNAPVITRSRDYRSH